MRKAKPKKRVILPDPVFNDVKVSKFVNHLMYDGKKNTSYEIFYAALETVKNKMQNEEKSTCPGVSKSVTVSSGSFNTACLEKMVIPLSFSSAKVSRNASLLSTRPALRIIPLS